MFLCILALHGFVLTKLIFFPYPELFIYPYLTNSGLIPYKQIFDQHFPGLMFLPINLNNLGMTSKEVARIWLIVIVLLTQILIFVITQKIFSDFKKSLLACLLYLIWQPFLEGYVLWIDNFLPLFLLPAFYFTYTSLAKMRDKWNYFLAGLFLSLAILFKQMAIPLSAMVFLLFILYRSSPRSLFLYFLGVLPIPSLMVTYFFIINDLKEFFYWTVIFNLTTFAQYGRKLPTITGLIRIAGIYSPVVFLPLLKNPKLVITILVFILGSLSGDLARFDFVHFQTSLPFLVILSAGVFFKIINHSLLRWFLIAYAFMLSVWSVIFYQGHLGSKTMFFDLTTYQISDKIKHYSRPGEEIFILGPVPHLYQMSQTVPAGRIFVFQFPWFLRVTQNKFLLALMNNPPALIVNDRSVLIEGNPITGYASELEDYINLNYTIIDKVGSTEFLKKK